MGELDTVELLRHARHDWLNKIQLIKGYLSLGKSERVEEIIDQIVKEAEIESRLSNIRLPHFVSLLLTYNWNSSKIILKYEVCGQGPLPTIDDNKLSKWFENLFNQLEKHASEWSENELLIRINLDANELRFNIHYKGILTNTMELNSYIEKNTESLSVSNWFLSDESLMFDVHF